jgi:pSer/pThr/pTyr-binding forkhead associated (FHA) protein
VTAVLGWLKRRKETEASPEEPSAAPPFNSLNFVAEMPTQGAFLEATDKDGQRLFLPLADVSVITLGTGSDCSVVLDERFEGVQQVAPKHAKLERWQNRWVLVPLERNAPIFVNGKRAGETALRDGTEIQLGSAGPKFLFRSESGRR